MILTRYILKDIFSYTASVSLIFLFIVLSSRSIQYLEQAARGELNPEIVFLVILYRLPEFLELIIPFSFFLTIVLVLGRLYADSEMVIIKQNGITTNHLLRILLSVGLFWAIVTSVFSFWLTPLFNKNLNTILSQTSVVDDFKTVQPGTFHRLKNQSIIFVKEREGLNLYNIFLKTSKNSSPFSEVLLTAKTAKLNENEETTLTMTDGLAFSDKPNKLMKIHFDQLVINLSDSNELKENIISKQEPFNVNNLQWKLSIPLLCIISVFIAVPLSRVNPRQGRYRMVLPNMLIFITYLGLLILFKGWLETGYISSVPGLFSIHLIFSFLAVWLIYRENNIRGKA